MKMKHEKEASTASEDWKKLYKSEEKKYKAYLEATRITNLTDLTKKLSPDFSKQPILTDY